MAAKMSKDWIFSLDLLPDSNNISNGNIWSLKSSTIFEQFCYQNTKITNATTKNTNILEILQATNIQQQIAKYKYLNNFTKYKHLSNFAK